MKNSIKKLSHISKLGYVICTCLLIIPACEDPSDPGGGGNIIVENSYTVGPEGGSIRALNGNVAMEIPEGALISTEKFKIEEGLEDDGDDFIIKSIIIKPKGVAFIKPVGLSLKYDGQLSCGKDPCNATSLVLYHFQDDARFDKRGPSDMLWECKCYVNVMDCCLETMIYTGGVFAIGEESMGKKKKQESASQAN